MNKIFYFKKNKYYNYSEYKLYLFGFLCSILIYGNDFGWFRLFGIGLKWKDINKGLTFSERNGYKKYLKIKNYYFGYLSYNTNIFDFKI